MVYIHLNASDSVFIEFQDGWNEMQVGIQYECESVLLCLRELGRSVASFFSGGSFGYFILD